MRYGVLLGSDPMGATSASLGGALAALLLLGAPEALAAGSLRRVAIAVGVDRFRAESPGAQNTDQGWARLAFARADAEAFAARLRDHGFERTVLVDDAATLDNVVSALERARSEDDPSAPVELVLFFATHGAGVDGGDSVLVLHDTPARRRLLADPDGLGLTRSALVAKYVEGVGDGVLRVAVFIDACDVPGGRTGAAYPGTPRTGAPPRPPPVFFGPSERARFVFSAVSEREASRELEDLGHGAYTYHLLKAIEAGARGRDLEDPRDDAWRGRPFSLLEAHIRAEAAVRSLSRGNQNPSWSASHASGTGFFFLDPTAGRDGDRPGALWLSNRPWWANVVLRRLSGASSRGEAEASTWSPQPVPDWGLTIEAPGAYELVVEDARGGVMLTQTLELRRGHEQLVDIWDLVEHRARHELELGGGVLESVSIAGIDPGLTTSPFASAGYRLAGWPARRWAVGLGFGWGASSTADPLGTGLVRDPSIGVAHAELAWSALGFGPLRLWVGPRLGGGWLRDALDGTDPKLTAFWAAGGAARLTAALHEHVRLSLAGGLDVWGFGGAAQLVAIPFGRLGLELSLSSSQGVGP